MKKKCILLVTALMMLQLMVAQTMKKQTLAIQGSSHFVYANNKSYLIQESIGQLSVINTFETNNYSLRQGFLQPISPSGISNQSDFRLEAIVYPNPFVSMFSIKFNEPVVDIVDLKLYDLLGRLIFNQEFNPEEMIAIDLGELSSGQYILRVKMRAQEYTASLIRR